MRYQYQFKDTIDMDNQLIYGYTLEGVRENFPEFTGKKNLKLKTSKFVAFEEVEFGGSVISSVIPKLKLRTLESRLLKRRCSHFVKC